MGLWLTGLAAALLILLAALLLAPLRLELRLADGVRLRLGLFGGLLPLPLFDSARPRKAATPRKTKPRRRGGGWRPSGAFLRALPGAAMEALGRIRIVEAWGECRLGLGDPALTGEFYGRAMGLLMASPLRSRLRLVPLFDRQAIEGEGALVLSLVPAQLLGPAWRLPWRQLWRRP